MYRYYTYFYTGTNALLLLTYPDLVSVWGGNWDRLFDDGGTDDRGADNRGGADEAVTPCARVAPWAGNRGNQASGGVSQEGGEYDLQQSLR